MARVADVIVVAIRVLIDVGVDVDVVEVFVSDAETRSDARVFRRKVVAVAEATSEPEASTGARVRVEIPTHRKVVARTALRRNETRRCLAIAVTCRSTCSKVIATKRRRKQGNILKTSKMKPNPFS